MKKNELSFGDNLDVLKKYAAMGVLTMAPATRGVKDAVDKGGIYTHPTTRQTFQCFST